MKTTVALVGRPNVGKSRLFNRLIGKRRSIVHDQPGVTRDIIAEDLGNGLIIMDTGGIGLSQELQTITDAVETQVYVAIESADLIFFVIDAKTELTALDYEIAEKLRKADKKIFLVANKIDTPKELYRCDNLHQLGLGEPIAISAEHGYGEEKLREILAPYIDENSEKNSDNLIKFCLIGRPNVGKSSVANTLINEKRFIESPIAGTTRDAVDFSFDFPFQDQVYHFQLVDTAGLRAKKKIDSSVEFFSALRTHDTIESSDVVIYIIDALTGMTRQDKKLIGQILAQGKCCILAVNKWDLAQNGIKESLIDGYKNIIDFQENFRKAILSELAESTKLPIIFISAKNGYAIQQLLNEVVLLYQRSANEISTGKLNRAIQSLIEQQPPAFVSGKRFKIYYAVQSKHFPITFKMFCNQSRRLTAPYKRYLERGIRDTFDLSGCPISFEFIDKEPRYSEKSA